MILYTQGDTAAVWQCVVAHEDRGFFGELLLGLCIEGDVRERLLDLSHCQRVEILKRESAVVDSYSRET